MISADIAPDDICQVIVERSPDLREGAWARLSEAFQRGVVGGTRERFVVTLDVFLSELSTIREVRQTFGIEVVLGASLRDRMQLLANDRKRREQSLLSGPMSKEMITSLLSEAKFRRPLRDFQIANLGRIAALPHAADFSVPGAGKTTVALANFALQRAQGIVSKALVVAPIAAFSTWKEEAKACFEISPKVDVHTPGSPLLHSTELLITNYHRLASDYKTLAEWSQRSPTIVFLDEAHRIKRGREGVHGRAALDLAFYAARRDLLTGTPTPQGATDLIALIEFLYPGQARQILPQGVFVSQLALDDQVMEAAHRATRQYFVRTRKSDLQLPPTTWQRISRPMGPVQEAIYQALVGTYRGSFQLGKDDRRQFRKMGKIVMYLLEAATNPLLLLAGSDESDSVTMNHDPLELQGHEPVYRLLQEYARYEKPWKYEYLKQVVASNSTAGRKTLIWSSFVRNIRLLQTELEAFQPAVIHGGVPLEDSPRPGSGPSRESELNRFKNDSKCGVLLANPAACGEGISLHHWCHHAIYLDRTFSAGHFLQSQDRIHRLGLKEGTETIFTLLVSDGSVDDTVDGRLVLKVRGLSKLMDDPGLVQVSLPGDEDDEICDDEVELDDVRALEAHLQSGG